jgi:hypothetical protein
MPEQLAQHLVFQAFNHNLPKLIKAWALLQAVCNRPLEE